MDIKDFKNYIRVLKEFKAYGNFMYNMHGADLYYFIDTDTCPYGMINMHACWSETPQGHAYWRYLHKFIYNNEELYFERLKYKDFKQQRMDEWKIEIDKENAAKH